MRRSLFSHRRLSMLALILLSGTVSAPAAAGARGEAPAGTNRYAWRAGHDPDGIGKFLLGREIAHVMGHPAADWLERPEREEEEHTATLVNVLGLKPGMVVADIGAGTGYFSRRMAPLISPRGRVLAVDIQPEMLMLLTNQAAKAGVTNIVPVPGTEQDPRLPAGSVDLALLVDVYHEFEHPLEMMAGICRALKPGGRHGKCSVPEDSSAGLVDGGGALKSTQSAFASHHSAGASLRAILRKSSVAWFEEEVQAATHERVAWLPVKFYGRDSSHVSLLSRDRGCLADTTAGWNT